MNKKMLIFIASAIGALLIAALAYSVVMAIIKQQNIKKDKAEITQTSIDFSNAWFNYTNQTLPSYQTSIKPYMTNDYYQNTYYVNTSRPQDFAGQLPQKASIKSTEITKYGSNAATVVESINTEDTSGAKQNLNISLTLTKSNDKWLVSDLETRNN